MKLSELIAEADVRVPNSFTDAQKVSWLNEVNYDFFGVVKIPLSASFTTAAGSANYVLSAATGSAIRGRQIDRVYVGTMVYRNFLYDDVPPGNNTFQFDETTSTITLTPAPAQSDLTGLVKYYKTPVLSFASANLTVEPDAPSDCHWIYVLGLCEKIALAQDDIPKASNNGQQYRGQLTIVQANYGSGGA